MNTTMNDILQSRLKKITPKSTRLFCRDALKFIDVKFTVPGKYYWINQTAQADVFIGKACCEHKLAKQVLAFILVGNGQPTPDSFAGTVKRP